MAATTATATAQTCWDFDFPELSCDECKAQLQTAAHTCWDADSLGFMCLACEAQRRAAAAKAAAAPRPLAPEVRRRAR